jgi:Dihydropteroate synthase and related enzymes
MVLRIFEIESKKRAINKIGETGADERAYPYLYPKMIHLSIEIKDVRARDANIIKQEMLSKGGDASISRDSYSLKNEVGKILLTGNLKCYLEVAKKLRIQPIKRIKVMADEIEDGIRNYLSEPFFKVKDEVYKKPLIMGILNITPDSFSDGGKFIDPQRALQRAVEMQNEGADIIDIGGESTRPGFTKIGIGEEEGRVIPVIKKIVEDGRVKVPLSMDTTKLEIVEKCLKLGVDSNQ